MRWCRQGAATIFDTKSDKVRLGPGELARLRRLAALHGEAVNSVRTQQELLEATMKGVDTCFLRSLVDDIQRVADSLDTSR